MTERRVERTAVRDDDTATRPPLTERIQAKLSQAADEHRANAQPESKTASRRFSFRAKKAGWRKRRRRGRTDFTRWSMTRAASA